MSPLISMEAWRQYSLRKTFGGKKLRHLENMPVIIALRQRISGFFVHDERHVGMHLQRGSADRRSDGPFDGFGHGGSFGTAGSQQQHALGFQNGADTHGDGTLR